SRISSYSASYVFVSFMYDSSCYLGIFFFQAEDGIRDATVTGVQTCALPIFSCARVERADVGPEGLPIGAGVRVRTPGDEAEVGKIGRASCRERGWRWGGAGSVKQKGMKRTARGRRGDEHGD